MKPDKSMETLMTVFSGVATLMCLLVGVQLLFLESQIGQAINPGQADTVTRFGQWKMLAHTGAIMSFGAGVLIFLFGLRNLTNKGQATNISQPNEDPVFSTPDLESVSVRIFEVDAEDRSIEITLQEDDRLVDETLSSLSAPRHHDDLVENLGEDPEPDPIGDPTDSIIESIHEASTPRSGPSTGSSPSGRTRPSFLQRLFRRR